MTGCGKKEDIGELGSIEESVINPEHEYETDENGEIIETDEDGQPVTEPETTLVEETTREPSESLPDFPIYDDTTLDGYTLNINNSERFTINYPEGYDAIVKDKYKTYLIKENTQIFFYCINQKFDTTNSVYYSTQVTDSLYRFPYAIDGVSFTASVIDRKAVEQKNINGKIVARETPMIEFASENIREFVKPTCVSYFTTFDDRGFALIAVSTDKTESELDTILTDMVSTLGTYIPSNKEVLYEFNGNKFVASDKTGISFPYPDGWKVTMDIKTGFVVISAPNDGGIYEGAKIIYKSDEKNEFVEDYAQFAGIPEQIAYIYMQRGKYDKDKLAADFEVRSMDDTVKIDGVKCYLFEIKDFIMPLNKTAELLLPSTGNEIYSFRYTFNSNSIPAMVSFHYTANNKYQVRDLADEIMKEITIK